MTEQQQWLSQKYILYKMLTNMWFVGAVWLYFYRLFITDQQIGILDGMAFAIGLIAEVPSGALADKFGRNRLVKLGQLLAGTGLLIQAFGSSFLPFFVGQAIMMIGVAFASGADEALFFEKLNFKRTSVEWRKLVTRGSQSGLIGSLIATLAGGYLHSINPRIPWLITGLSFLLAVIAIWTIKETRQRQVQKNIFLEIQDYIDDIKTGFATFKLPKLWLYVPLILTVQGVFYATGWGLLRLVLLDRFHFNPFWGSVAIASSSLVTIGILAFMHKNAEQMSEKRVLTLISLSAAMGLLLSIPNIGVWGYFVILALYVGEFTLYPFMSEILNHKAPDDRRATVLSVASFLRTMPYVALAPLIGFLNTRGRLEFFFIIWAFFIIMAVLFYLSKKKRDELIPIAEV